jgi:hypothetical protein
MAKERLVWLQLMTDDESHDRATLDEPLFILRLRANKSGFPLGRNPKQEKGRLSGLQRRS